MTEQIIERPWKIFGHSVSIRKEVWTMLDDAGIKAFKHNNLLQCAARLGQSLLSAKPSPVLIDEGDDESGHIIAAVIACNIPKDRGWTFQHLLDEERNKTLEEVDRALTAHGFPMRDIRAVLTRMMR